MFSKKSFISVSAIQEEESIKSTQNQSHLSTFPSAFYFDLKQNKANQYVKKPLQPNNNSHHNQTKTFYKRNIKTESDHVDDLNNNIQNNFFSGQSFRNINIEQTNQKFSYDSMKRQYETRLQKQKQFFELKQWKYQQEIQNLTAQIQTLLTKIDNKQKELSQSTIISTPSNSRLIQICKTSDGPNQQFNIHLKKMLKRVQKQHQQCIQTKKELLTQIQNYKLKLSVSQQKIKQLQQQLISKKQIIKQISFKNQTLSQKVSLQKTKCENQEKNTTKLIQGLQMRMDQCKYQNQALKRQINLNIKKPVQNESKQDRALKILNNSFSFVENQAKSNFNSKVPKFSIKKQSCSTHLSDRELVSKMYNKSLSFFKTENEQKQTSLGCLRDRFREVLQDNQNNIKSTHNVSFLQKYKSNTSFKENYSKTKQSALRFKYL